LRGDFKWFQMCTESWRAGDRVSAANCAAIPKSLRDLDPDERKFGSLKSNLRG